MTYLTSGFRGEVVIYSNNQIFDIVNNKEVLLINVWMF